jgi:hypothetical protein
MYQPSINRGDLVGQAQENIDQGNFDASKQNAFKWFREGTKRIMKTLMTNMTGMIGPQLPM